ncbi:MAG: hypothetical protein FWH04_04625 [Oscillospiraceae bacterium]|nr:hypothetical protein [Oscillospiraceae bacterium]
MEKKVKVELNDDGTLKRLDEISQIQEDGKHRHAWLKKTEEGDYKYGTHPADSKTDDSRRDKFSG